MRFNWWILLLRDKILEDRITRFTTITYFKKDKIVSEYLKYRIRLEIASIVPESPDISDY